MMDGPSIHHSLYGSSNPAVIASIPQAFRLHGVLETSYDYSSDDEYSDDSCMFSDTESEDENENNNKVEENENATSVALIKVGIEDNLLRQPAYSESDKCANSIFRADMWAADPRIHLGHLRMGFLSQLAQVCVRSKLYDCQHGKCIEKKDSLKQWAPECKWDNFRDWALVAMSCQAAMGDSEKLSRAHTHLARVASGCFRVLKKCLDKWLLSFTSFLDGEGPEEYYHIELSEVFNLIYWMAGIQSQLGTGPAEFSKWNHYFLPLEYTIGAVQSAAYQVENLNVCKNRLWNLVNINDRKQDDLPDIVLAIIRHKEFMAHKGHDTCSPRKCQEAQMDSTKVGQLHKCKAVNDWGENTECQQKSFPLELLLTNIELGKRTAWLCKTERLCSNDDPYIAISHVWSDGTGVGLKSAGSVNSCLFKFFADIAEKLECKALWWDTLSIPYEPKARSKALSVMHGNYANAKHTVVHDNYLLNFPWSEDGAPCLALVLSTWFTRGWTALELAMSKSVKVLFKDPQSEGLLIKDLDADILAQSPRDVSRAHWLATSLIQRLRRPIDDVGDLVTILAPRSTSWIRDRTIISSLLAGVPDPDFSKGESEITKDVLQYLGKVPYSSLLHGKATMHDRGGFSWSTATLDDLPVEGYGDSQDADDTFTNAMLEIDDSGAVWGVWAVRNVDESDISKDNIEPYGDDIAATLKVQLALADWRRCMLLRPSMSDRGPKALLVAPTAILKDGPTLKCSYIGTVTERESQRKLYFAEISIQIGGKDEGERALPTARLVGYLGSIDKDTKFNDKDEMVLEDADKDLSAAEMSDTPGSLGEWLGREDTERPSSWLAVPDTNESSYPPDLSIDALKKALQANNRSATRYLVKQGIHINPNDVDLMTEDDTINEKVQEKSKDEKLARSLTLLGDVYAENRLIELAIETYYLILQGPWAQSTEGKNSLAFLDIQLALGRALTTIQQDNLSDDVSIQCIQWAGYFFHNILGQCKDNGNFRAVELKKKRRWPPPGTSASNSMADTQTSEQNSSNDAEKPPNGVANEPTNSATDRRDRETVDRRGDERKAIKWLQLELNAVAEMVALAVSHYDFTRATKAFQRAMRYFGETIQEFEGFKPRWAERRTQKATDKAERDETVASTYQRALKRLSSLFKKHHPLILITQLHLGVNYNLRSKFKEAETHLKQVLSGLIGRTEQSVQKSFKTHYSLAGIQNNHVLVALTRYYLGMAYLGQDRFKHARDELTQAREITPVGRPECNELHYSITLALCRNYIDQDPPNIKEAIDLALSIIQSYQTQASQWGVDRRLVVEAQMSLAEALYKAGGPDNIKNAIDVCEYTMDLADKLEWFEENDLDQASMLVLSADLFEDSHQYKQAEDLRIKACNIYRNLEGPDSLSYLKSTYTLYKTHQKAEHGAEAKAKLKDALRGFEKTMGKYATRTLRAYQALGELYLSEKNMEMAKEYHERAFQGFQKRYGTTNRLTAAAAYSLGTVYYRSSKFSQAREMFLTAYNGFKEDYFTLSKKTNKFPKAITSVTVDLAECCAALGGPNYEGDAEKFYSQALDDLEKHGGEQAQDDMFRVKLKLGELFRQKKQLDKAKVLIIKAYHYFLTRKQSQVDDDYSIERWEAMLRLGELRLNLSQVKDKGNEQNENNGEDEEYSKDKENWEDENNGEDEEGRQDQENEQDDNNGEDEGDSTDLGNEEDENNGESEVGWKEQENEQDDSNEEDERDRQDQENTEDENDGEDEEGREEQDDRDNEENREDEEDENNNGNREDQENNEVHEREEVPEVLIRKARDGLLKDAGDKHLLTLQAAVLLGEICLDGDSTDGCTGEQELQFALDICEKALPSGSPMTIKAMDYLINYWTKQEPESDKIHEMTQRKWKALKDGYGLDTAIAIMKMTDPKRENLVIWNTRLSEDSDGGDDGGDDSGAIISDEDSLSEDEDEDFWGQDEEQNETEGKHINLEEYQIGDQYMNGDGQPVMEEQDSPQPPDDQELLYNDQPQYIRQPENVEDILHPIIQSPS